MLGVFYGTGRGVTKDYNEAVKWYRKAAEKGSAAGQYNLARYYEMGYGIAQDWTEALRWYRKAAESGDKDAPKKVEELTAKLAAESKSAKTYKVGDYYNENGKRGVVFEVWDGGRHGKIISLDETRAVWDSRVKYDSKKVLVEGTRTYADSESDGKANTDKIMARSDSQYFPPFKWCRAKGSSWYLPAKDELNQIYNNKDKLNSTLSQYGTALRDHFYWSSTEDVKYSLFYAWAVDMDNGYTLFSTAKCYDKYVRAVSAF